MGRIRKTMAILMLLCAAAGAEDAKEKALVEGNNAFALELYGKLRAGEGNLFFSPYSISSALAMTYAGARGNTAAEMAKTLRFAIEDKDIHPAFAALQGRLNAPGKKGYELVVANALWGEKGYGFLDDFLKLTQQHYGAGLTELDFVAAAEQARGTINAWVQKQTRDKIKDLIKPGVITDLTRLVLTNAIYFKGKWAEQFDKSATQEAPFSVTETEKVTAPMMSLKGDFGYMGDDSLQALEMPYAGGELSMLVLLPKSPAGLAEIEKSLTPKSLAGWILALRTQEVQVCLPRFKMTGEFSLAETLRSMGMSEAFTDKADFSGMDGKRDLVISAVVHKAFVDVNEEGTEAAAATGVIIGSISVKPPPPVFRADHPFLFLIRHEPTGAILFLGRVADPKA